jgi:hypothetical protein
MNIKNEARKAERRNGFGKRKLEVGVLFEDLQVPLPP